MLNKKTNKKMQSKKVHSGSGHIKEQCDDSIFVSHFAISLLTTSTDTVNWMFVHQSECSHQEIRSFLHLSVKHQRQFGKLPKRKMCNMLEKQQANNIGKTKQRIKSERCHCDQPWSRENGRVTNENAKESKPSLSGHVLATRLKTQKKPTAKCTTKQFFYWNR